MNPFEQQIHDAARRSARPVGACLSVEDLIAFYSGRAQAAAAGEIRRHLSLCPACLETARDYCRFAGIEAMPETTRSLRQVFHSGIPAAAAILLAFVIGGIWISTNPQMDPSRSAIRAAAPQAEIEMIRPLGDLREVGPMLEWRPVSGAARYEVDVRDARLNVIWKESGIVEPRAQLPSDVVSRFQPGGIYGWRVTALSIGGSRMASGFGNFKIVAQ